MSADLRIGNNRVTAEAHTFRVSGPDLQLRSPARLEKANPLHARNDAPRRALVHSTSDSLIVNYNGDYTETEVHGALRVRASDRTNVPAVYVMNGHGRSGVALLGPSGKVVCQDISVKGLRYGGSDGTDSLLKTIDWLHKRIEQLERQLDVQTRTFPTEQRG